MFKREREEVLRPKGKREPGKRGKLQAAPTPATFSNRTASHARTHARTKRNDFPVGGSAGSTRPPTSDVVVKEPPVKVVRRSL